MPDVVINFSNVSISVAVVFVGGYLLYGGYMNDIEKMRNAGLFLILGGVVLYVALLEIYGRR